LDEFIENRLIFAPIRPFSTLTISDKISLTTVIVSKYKKVISLFDQIIFEKLKEILNIGSYVLIEKHEVFHLLDCIPFYENNCSIPINTPRKKNYEGKSEGGEYLELLLFDKIIHNLSLSEALFLLNEKNYDKLLKEFKKDFKKLDEKDLIIEGTFSYYNDYLKEKLSFTDLKNTYIIQKIQKMLIPNSSIYLQNDVIGRK